MKVVNLDWLEVYCLEPAADVIFDANHFEMIGWQVQRRDYGTPQYKECFTLFDADHFPLYEIRRAPYSLKPEGGIFDPRACHIRLSNRACYQLNCIGQLRDFLLRYGYEYKSISRVDICADCNTFDDKRDPGRFLCDFMGGKWLKIHQGKLAAHGIEYIYKGESAASKNISTYASDFIGGRSFNSIKWGAPTSAISTKMYDKTLELSHGKPKKYIQNLWKTRGLISDDTTHVWRVEFSIKSDWRNFVKLDTGELLYLNLTTIDTPDKLNGLFCSLAQLYFHFKLRRRTRNGTPQRKDRCPDFWPFKYDPREAIKPIRLTLTKDPTRTDRIIMRRLAEIYEGKLTQLSSHEQKNFLEVIEYFAEQFDDETLRDFHRRHEDFLYLLNSPD